MTNWKDVRNSIETGEYAHKIPEGMKTISVVGVSFVDGYPGNILKLVDVFRNRQGDIFVQLVRNPNNKYDQNAIEVRLNNDMLGHLPREIAAELAPKMDAGYKFISTLYQIRISPENPNNPGLDVLIDGFDYGSDDGA